VKEAIMSKVCSSPVPEAAHEELSKSTDGIF
jgi:hypothetical protein